jgi:hypothetical protein
VRAGHESSETPGVRCCNLEAGICPWKRKLRTEVKQSDQQSWRSLLDFVSTFPQSLWSVCKAFMSSLLRTSCRDRQLCEVDASVNVSTRAMAASRSPIARRNGVQYRHRCWSHSHQKSRFRVGSFAVAQILFLVNEGVANGQADECATRWG